MADKVVGRGVVKIEADADLTEISKDFDRLEKDITKAFDDVQDTLRKASTEIGQGFGKLSDSNQNLKDGFGDLSGAASAVGAGLVSAGVISEETGAKLTAAADITGGLEGAFTALQGSGTLLTGVMGKLQLSTLKDSAAKAANIVVTGAATVATTVFAAAQRVLNAVLRANPIGIVITVLAALVAALIFAWKNSETFRDTVKGAFDIVKSAASVLGIVFGAVFGAIRAVISVGIGIVQAYLGVVQGVFKAVIGVISGAGQVVGGIFRGIGSELGFVGDAFRAARDTVSGFVNQIVGFITGLPGRILDAGGALLNAGKALIGKLFEGVKSAAGAVGGFVADLAQSLKNAINNLLNLPFTVGPIEIPGPLPDIPRITIIPALARGTSFFEGGTALVGEEGPELVNLPRGSRVTPAEQTRAALAASTNVEITQVFTGPTTSGGRLRELDWTLRYATQSRSERFGGAA